MWTLDPRDSVPAWRATPSAAGARLGFSTRRGGVSAPPFHWLNLGRSTDDDPAAVAENRHRLLASFDLDDSTLATAGQVHGAEIATVHGAGHHPGFDALLTVEPGVPLAITTADCMPVLFDAPGGVAAAHSGWRGTAAGILAATLGALCGATGARPRELRVALGPCIRACCYEVGPEVASRFPAEAVRREGERLTLDLPRAARLQLREAGLPDDRFEDTGGCTACEPEWYFSHRRDAGRTGRHWGIACRLG